MVVTVAALVVPVHVLLGVVADALVTVMNAISLGELLRYW